MPPGMEGTARTSGENHRQIIVAVCVAIAQPATIDDHRVVEQRLAVAILRLPHPLEEPGQLSHVELINLGNLLQLLWVALMMGEIVMAVGNSFVLETPVTAVMRQKKSRHTRGIGLKG